MPRSKIVDRAYASGARTLNGIVVRGRALGRTIGFPTANLQPDAGQSLPPHGVYAAICETDGKTYAGMTNVGMRPTVDDSAKVTVESWLSSFSGDLYGKRLRVTLLARIRGVQRFADLNALKAQLARDREEAVRICAEYKSGGDTMREYEILVETVNPCGGESHAKKEIIEAECESPEAYVKKNAPYPVMEVTRMSDDETRVITGDGKGGIVRYTFTEL